LAEACPASKIPKRAGGTGQQRAPGQHRDGATAARDQGAGGAADGGPAGCAHEAPCLALVQRLGGDAHRAFHAPLGEQLDDLGGRGQPCEGP
jgi:hypothetical protein